MFTNRVFLLVTFILVTFIGCTRQPSVDTRADADAIRELDRQWDAAVKARDIDKILSFYAPDAVEMPANAQIFAGHEAIRKWYGSWVTDTAVSNTFGPVVTEVAASGDLAFDRGTYHFIQNTPKGPVEDIGKYIVIWRKIDGQWKAIVDISNSDKSLTP